MERGYGFDPFDSCVDCTWKRTGFFCQLADAALENFDRISFASVYPAGAILHTEGQKPRGMFLICRGKVKLSVTSGSGKTIITRIAVEGDVLGVSNLIRDAVYGSTAETLESTQIRFVRKDDFLRFIEDHSEGCLHAVQQTARELEASERRVRALGLSRTAGERLGLLILEWRAERERKGLDVDRIPFLMTHRELAQLIGATRETATRLIGELKSRGVIEVRGSNLIVRDLPALEEYGQETR